MSNLGVDESNVVKKHIENMENKMAVFYLKYNISSIVGIEGLLGWCRWILGPIFDFVIGFMRKLV